MKYVWTVLMNQNAGFVVMVISITADVWTFVANQYFLVRTSGESFGQHTPGKTRSHNQIIKHNLTPLVRTVFQTTLAVACCPALATRVNPVLERCFISTTLLMSSLIWFHVLSHEIFARNWLTR